MTDIEGGRAAETLVGLRFKRQQRQKPVHIDAHLLRAARTPGPDGRRHVVDNWNMRRALAHPLGDIMREIRAVDDNQDIRIGRNRSIDGLIDAPHDGGQPLQDRRQPHDCNVG